MPTDRPTAVSAALRATDGLKGRGTDSYGAGEWRNDTLLMADHLLADTPPADTDPDNPVGDVFLQLAGFKDATGGGNSWALIDADGRELVYTLIHPDTGEPHLRLVDDEGDGANLPCPPTEGELLALCHALRFPARDPAAG